MSTFNSHQCCARVRWHTTTSPLPILFRLLASHSALLIPLAKPSVGATAPGALNDKERSILLGTIGHNFSYALTSTQRLIVLEQLSDLIRKL